MDEILPTQKVSAINHEAQGFLDYTYDANDFYKVDKMSFEETKENLDWRKQYEKKNSYGNENINDMMRIHNNEVRNIAEWIYYMM